MNREFTRQVSCTYNPLVRRPCSDTDGEANRYTCAAAPLLRMCSTSPGTLPSTSIAALVGERLAEPLAADLEVVAAAPTVL